MPEPRTDPQPGAVYVPELVGPAWPLSPAPAQDAVWDWIQTTSGEWLKGHIKVMRDTVLEFDSDEFELQSLDWEDIKQVRSARMMAVFYDKVSVERGYLSTEGATLVIDGAERQVRVPLVDVVSIGVGTLNEKDLWSADVSVGANLRTGNVDEIDMNVMAGIKRRTERSSFQIDYRGNYSERSNIRSSNDHRATVTTDRLLSRDWFVRPVSVEFFRDEFQNIDQQWTLGIGAGYFIANDPVTRWVLVGGPGYLQTTYATVQAGESLVQQTPALLLGTDFEHELTRNIDVEASYSVTLVDDESGRALHSLVTAVDVDLTALLDLRVALSIDRVDKPQPDETGVAPEENDARLTVGLDYEI